MLDVTPGTSGIDLTTVSAYILKVKRPDGSLTTWAVTASNQTTVTLRLTHPISGDVSEAGTYYIYASLTIPGGTARTKPRALIVYPEYGTAA